MEQKKSDKANLETKRTVFLEIGFVLALALVLFAFEYKSYDKVEYTNIERAVDDTPEEIIPITEQKVKPPPPKPPPQVTIINVVEDDVEVEDEVDESWMDDTDDLDEDFEDFERELPCQV